MELETDSDAPYCLEFCQLSVGESQLLVLP